MGSFKTFATIGAMSLTLVTAAKAADLPRPSPSMTLPPPIVQRATPVDEFSSGWYLRGDIAYRMNRLGDVSNIQFPQPTTSKIDKSAAVGVGVGYKWNWFRTDLTIDYGTKTKYWGDSVFLSPDFTTRIDSLSALVNVYGDLGTWYGLTPYVGAGIGGTNLATGDFIEASLPLVDSPPRHSKWNVAWAWMAGVSYKFSQNWAIDLGYRRLYMGDAATGIDFWGNQLAFKRLSTDEVRLGVRYLID